MRVALTRLFAHGDELFGNSRVNADGGVELRFGGAELHRDCHALDDLACIRPDHVRADHPLRGPVDHDSVPTAVFANPNLATVGLSEQMARQRYGEVDVYKTYFRPLKLTLTEKKERVFMKLVVERASQRVVGAHMIGPDAGEIIQGVAIAVKLGATKAQFDATIGIHPTVAEEFVTMREKAT